MSSDLCYSQGDKTLPVFRISPTSMRARIFKMQLFIGQLRFPDWAGFSDQKLTPRTCVKFSRRGLLEEAKTIIFVSAHTTVPIPKIHKVLLIGDRVFMIMDVAEGKLAYSWSRFSQTQQDKVVEQLRDYIGQIRAIPPPDPDVAGSLTGGHIHDGKRIGYRPVRPFKDYDEFHKFLRDGIELNQLIAIRPDLPGTQWMTDIAQSHSQRYSSNLTHGDFAPRNILVAGRDAG